MATREQISGHTETTPLLPDNHEDVNIYQRNKGTPDEEQAQAQPETSVLGRNLTWSSAYLLTISRVLGSGIFATPGIILASVGSPGLSLAVWVVGALLAFIGMTVYLELGCMLPRSGGEKTYLEFAFRRPKYLAGVLVAVYALLLSLTASNCVIFAQYTLFAFDIEATALRRKTLALGLLTAIVMIHIFFHRGGIWIQNCLGRIKIGLIAFMIGGGILVIVFRLVVHDSEEVNSRHLLVDAPNAADWSWAGLWAGSIWSWGAIATSILKVFYSFAGIDNVNMVLNEVKDPVRTVRSVSVISFITACVIYALANVAYFLVVPLDEFRNNGELIAALFFERVFGVAFGKRVLPLMVALSGAGNVMVVTFALSRLKQEIARSGLIPFSRILSSTEPFGSPTGGLIIHWIPSALVLVIPSSDVYAFILEVENYAGQIVALAVSCALILLRYRHPGLERPFKAWLPGVGLRITISFALLLAPLFPSQAQRSHGLLRSAAYALVGYAVLLLGIVYWVVFAKILPKWRGYRLVERVDVLHDGTTVQTIDHVPNV